MRKRLFLAACALALAASLAPSAAAQSDFKNWPRGASPSSTRASRVGVVLGSGCVEVGRVGEDGAGAGGSPPRRGARSRGCFGSGPLPAGAAAWSAGAGVEAVPACTLAGSASSAASARAAVRSAGAGAGSACAAVEAVESAGVGWTDEASAGGVAGSASVLAAGACAVSGTSSCLPATVAAGSLDLPEMACAAAAAAAATAAPRGAAVAGSWRSGGGWSLGGRVERAAGA